MAFAFLAHNRIPASIAPTIAAPQGLSTLQDGQPPASASTVAGVVVSSNLSSPAVSQSSATLPSALYSHAAKQSDMCSFVFLDDAFTSLAQVMQEYDRDTINSFICQSGIRKSCLIPAMPAAYLGQEKYSIYVLGVPDHVQISEFQAIFRPYGDVVSCPTIIDWTSRETFRWIVMRDADIVTRLIRTQRIQWNGLSLYLLDALPPGRTVTSNHYHLTEKDWIPPADTCDSCPVENDVTIHRHPSPGAEDAIADVNGSAHRSVTSQEQIETAKRALADDENLLKLLRGSSSNHTRDDSEETIIGLAAAKNERNEKPRASDDVPITSPADTYLEKNSAASHFDTPTIKIFRKKRVTHVPTPLNLKNHNKIGSYIANAATISSQQPPDNQVHPPSKCTPDVAAEPSQSRPILKLRKETGAGLRNVDVPIIITSPDAEHFQTQAASWANIAKSSTPNSRVINLQLNVRSQGRRLRSVGRIPDIDGFRPPHSRENVAETMRVVFLLNLPNNIKLEDVSNAVKEGPIRSIHFGIDEDQKSRYAAIVFQHARDSESFTNALLKERAESHPDRFQFIVEVARGEEPFPTDNIIRAMGPPVYASRRLTLVKAGFFFQIHERTLRQHVEALVEPKAIQLIWLYNGGNATIVFRDVEAAMKVKESFDKYASGELPGGFSAAWVGLQTNYSRDPCVAPLDLKTALHD